MAPDGALLRNISLHNGATSVRLERLQPGTAYTVAVVTEAAGLQSSASVQAVTGVFGGVTLLLVAAVDPLDQSAFVISGDVISAGRRVQSEAGQRRQLTQPPGLLAPCGGRGGLVSADPVCSGSPHPGEDPRSQHHPGAVMGCKCVDLYSGL